MAAEYVALGLRPGDRVAILSENRPEWTVADMATQTAGGATVGVYTTSSPEQLRYFLQHSDAVGLVLEDAGFSGEGFLTDTEVPDATTDPGIATDESPVAEEAISSLEVGKRADFEADHQS